MPINYPEVECHYDQFRELITSLTQSQAQLLSKCDFGGRPCSTGTYSEHIHWLIWFPRACHTQAKAAPK